jgi:hypothetical protein
VFDYQKIKPGRFSKLPRSQRNRVRVVARDSFFESNGNLDKAIDLVSDRVRRVVGAVYVGIGQTLAITLVKYWLENNVVEPESIFVPGEPGFDEVGE